MRELWVVNFMGLVCESMLLCRDGVRECSWGWQGVRQWWLVSHVSEVRPHCEESDTDKERQHWPGILR